MKYKPFYALAISVVALTGCSQTQNSQDRAVVTSSSASKQTVTSAQPDSSQQSGSTTQTLSTDQNPPSAQHESNQTSPTIKADDFTSYEGKWRRGSGLSIGLHFTTLTDATLELEEVSPPPAYDITKGKTDLPVHFSSDGTAKYSFKDNRDNDENGTIRLNEGKVEMTRYNETLEFLREDAYRNIDQLTGEWDGQHNGNVVFTYATSPTELQVIIQHKQKPDQLSGERLTVYGFVTLNNSQSYNMHFNHVESPEGIQDIGDAILSFQGDQLTVTTKIEVGDPHSSEHFPEGTEIYHKLN